MVPFFAKSFHGNSKYVLVHLCMVSDESLIVRCFELAEFTLFVALGAKYAMNFSPMAEQISLVDSDKWTQRARHRVFSMGNCLMSRQ